MLLSFLFNTLGVFLFLFLFWKKLKEDYPRDVVFATTFFILFFLSVGFLISKRFFPHWLFWSEAFFALLGFSIAYNKYNLRFFEVFEATFHAFLPWLTLYYFSNFILSPSILGFVVFGLTLSLIFVFDYISLRYKNFAWFKSGKIGLAGLLTAGLFFLIRGFLVALFPLGVSFAGRNEILLSAICVFTLSILVYNLARKEF